MTKALILSDKSDWSYMQIAQAIQKHNTDPDLDIDVRWLKGRESEFLSVEKGYDRVLIMGHQMVPGLIHRGFRIDPERHLTGIHSHHAFDPELLTTPERDVPPPTSLLKMLRKFRGVNAVSERLCNLFHLAPKYHLMNIAYTPNGVDVETFKPMSPLFPFNPAMVGTAYTPKHDARKGVSKFIRPACEKAEVDLVEAKARSETWVDPKDMPAWHNSYDVYVCASSSEGFSIAILEAAASGRVCISTRVGGSTELIRHGVNGILVDRTVDAIADAIAWVNTHRDEAAMMGRLMRENVVANWSWEKRVPAWLQFIRS